MRQRDNKMPFPRTSDRAKRWWKFIVFTVTGSEVMKEEATNYNFFEEFLVNGGLYLPVEVTQDNIGSLSDVLSGKKKIECYCSECKALRVFELIPAVAIAYIQERPHIVDLNEEMKAARQAPGFIDENKRIKDFKWISYSIWNEPLVINLSFQCSMHDSHRLDFQILSRGNNLIKIGQYPSLADIQRLESNNYKAIIEPLDKEELGRAEGLYAHGIGAGSFVYLRRIIERLIDSTYKEAVEDGHMTLHQEFNRLRTKEKISALKGYLPEFMVENIEIYGILSAGVHDLSEQDCIKFYPVLHECILMILDEKENDRKKKQHIKELRSSISKIQNEVMSI